MVKLEKIEFMFEKVLRILQLIVEEIGDTENYSNLDLD